MDIVITYVNQDDPKWQEQALKYKPDLNINKSHRFKDYGTLPYLLRGIAKYIPFIKNVFLVVQGMSQVPAWINRNSVKIITHDQIIPKEFLPTFNSCTIETFLHNIPGLDEQFVYFNDDMYPINPIQAGDFFSEDGYPVTRMLVQPRSVSRLFHHQLYYTTQAAAKLANVKMDDQMLRPEHSVTSMLKSVNSNVYDSLKDEINPRISRFRSKENITQYLPLYYLYLKKQYKPRGQKILKYFSSNDEDWIDNFEDECASDRFKIVCVNDEGMKPAVVDRMINAFAKQFPEKCKYENPEPIDYVIPFVDFADPAWHDVYKKYAKADSQWWYAGECRYRDWGVLKYHLRSLEKNMPWLRYIYIVVSISESQVPEWLNTDHPKVKIILDTDIVPQSLLPTFNSNTVDLFMCNIPGISKLYLYACDDYVITKPLKPSDFFTPDGKVKQYMCVFYMNPNHPYTQTIVNSNDFVAGAREKLEQTKKELFIQEKDGLITGYKSNHGLVPHNSVVDKQYLMANYSKIVPTITKFRDPKNITWLVYQLNMLLLGQLVKDKHLKVQKNNVKNMQNVQKINTDDYDLIVINDDYVGGNVDLAIKVVDAKLNAAFPMKSKFEK